MTSRQPEKDRSDFIRDLVMTSMADNFENLQLIFANVTSWARSRDVSPTRDEVIRTIENVIVDGYAQSYLLSPHPPHSTPVAFDLKRVDDLHYYLTPAGKAIVKNVEDLGVGD
jgi:hypothetical protein